MIDINKILIELFRLKQEIDAKIPDMAVGGDMEYYTGISEGYEKAIMLIDREMQIKGENNLIYTAETYIIADCGLGAFIVDSHNIAGKDTLVEAWLIAEKKLKKEDEAK